MKNSIVPTSPIGPYTPVCPSFKQPLNQLPPAAAIYAAILLPSSRWQLPSASFLSFPSQLRLFLAVFRAKLSPKGKKVSSNTTFMYSIYTRFFILLFGETVGEDVGKKSINRKEIRSKIHY